MKQKDFKNFTPDYIDSLKPGQVFVSGKGYTDSLTEEEKADITTESSKYGVLEIQENIPMFLRLSFPHIR